jgi:hypothetical protein
MRYNPPPNWPPPPPGWMPGPGWQPDPAWGPPPAGWQLWTEDRSSADLLQASWGSPAGQANPWQSSGQQPHPPVGYQRPSNSRRIVGIVVGSIVAFTLVVIFGAHEITQSDVNSAVDSDISSIRAASPTATTPTYSGPTIVIENNVMTLPQGSQFSDASPTFRAQYCTDITLVNRDSVPHHVMNTASPDWD